MASTTINNYSEEQWDKLIDTLKTDRDVSLKAVNPNSGDDAEEAPLGWFLKNLDLSTSTPQSVEREADRLMNLKSYNILDKGEDDEFRQACGADFDRLTKRACEIFDVPVAVISMVDAGRQYFVSRQNLDATETPRSCAFCAHVIEKDDGIMLINDATKDPRFSGNPLVTGGPKIRFYCGAKVTSPQGLHLGTICAIGFEPKEEGSVTKRQLCDLKELAHQTMNAIMEHWLFDEM